MPLNTVRYDMDPLKSGNKRDYNDFNLRKATVTLLVTGTLAGISISINTPSRVLAGLPAIVVAEPADFVTVIGDKRSTLQNLVAAIVKKTNGALKPRLSGDASGIYAVGANFEVVLEAAQIGSWGESITFVHGASANAGNLTTNGTAGAGSFAPLNGAGPDALTAFGTFLTGLGVPITDNRVVPLFTESTSFLVTYETP